MSASSPPCALHLKRDENRAARRTPDLAAEPVHDRRRSRVLACAACERHVTSDDARIAVAGRHEHTFANPYGFAYHIGCFSVATGLTRVGPPSGEFAWFAGHTWQIEQCAQCGEHLGWLFRGPAGAFHGLVLDKLVEVSDESPQ